MNDALGKLPPVANWFPGTTPGGNTPLGTVPFHILPYIEQQNVYSLALNQPAPVVDPNTGLLGPDMRDSQSNPAIRSTIIKTYVCPSDGSGPHSTTWAVGNYTANQRVFGNRLGGGNSLQTSMQDGTSNTVLFAERYNRCYVPSVDANGNPITIQGGGLWAHRSSSWGTFFSSTAMFQVRPNWSNGECNRAVPQSSHTGGMNVCLGDGSVRFLSAGLNPTTWSLAVLPADGQPNGSDW